MSARHNIINTLRLSDREATELLTEVERMARSAPPEGITRSARRWKLQAQRAILSLRSQTGERQHLLAVPRNISTGGISLLYGGFLHQGTACEVMLRSVGGATEPVRGTVRRCRHVSGRFHELGIEFERNVNPREYLISIGSDYLFNAEKVEPSQLRGRVMLFTVDDADRRAYLRELAETRIEIECIDDPAAAIARLGSEFDLVFADVDGQEDLAVEFAERARHSKKLAPIVVIVRSDDPELRLAAIGAGASELLFKPVGTELLYQAATEYLACIHDDELAGISMDMRTVSDAPDELSNEWLHQLGAAADTLEADVAARVSQSAIRTLKTMHDLARRFGLTHAAECLLNASRSLERCGQCSGAMTEIRRALRSVRRIGAVSINPPSSDQVAA